MLVQATVKYELYCLSILLLIDGKMCDPITGELFNLNTWFIHKSAFFSVTLHCSKFDVWKIS